MDTQTEQNNYSYISSAFEQRLNDISWPIKCHWAKYFPIKIITTEDIDVAAIDFEKVYVHPLLSQADDAVLFCILAHEWAHRMVSPKSVGVKKRIIEAVADALTLDLNRAALVSAPAIELIVDRSNSDIQLWSETYQQGFITCFSSFIEDMQKKNINAPKTGQQNIEFNKMMLALRLANMSDRPLPTYIHHYESRAREMISILFDGWTGYNDASDPDHIKRIIHFSQAFFNWLPKELMTQHKHMIQILIDMVNDLGNPASLLAAVSKDNGLLQGNASNARKIQPSTDDRDIFDLKLTRQVTDYLIRQAHKPRQLTGLWQPGHSFSKLDLKRSFRCSPTLIPGITTRRKTDSNRMHHYKKGQQLRLCMVVDDSASMSGDEAKFARSICEGINCFAATRDLHIGLITFGGDIDISWLPQRRYSKIRKALSRLDGNLGGTNLKPALQRLAQFVASDNDITHAMLITDASFWDWDDCQKSITDILEHINITILMINGEIPDNIFTAITRHQHSINMFKVDPSKATDIAILEEVIR